MFSQKVFSAAVGRPIYTPRQKRQGVITLVKFIAALSLVLMLLCSAASLVQSSNKKGGRTLATLAQPTPSPEPSLTLSFNNAACGGNDTTGVVTLEPPAPPTGAVISLFSDNIFIATVPNSVTIGPGQTSAAFPITTFSVTQEKSVDISASYSIASVKKSFSLKPLLSVTLSSQEHCGGQVSEGTVTLNCPVPSSSTLVTLSSDNVAAAVTPSSVTFPPGVTREMFSVRTALVTSQTEARITAVGPTQHGLSFSDTTLTINPALSFSLADTVLNGGESTTGTVTLNCPPAVGATSVALSSNNPAVFIQSSVTLPQGTSTASFPLIASVNVSAPVNVTIIASYAGISQRAVLTVNPPPPASGVKSLSINSTNTCPGQSATGVVVLDGRAPPAGALVSLTTDSSAARVPTSVIVPAGLNTATFTVTASPDETEVVAVTVTASYNGVSQDAPFTVGATLLELVVNPNKLQGGSSTTGSVRLNCPAPPAGAEVSLSTSQPSTVHVPSAVMVPSGSAQAVFLISTAAVTENAVVTVTASRGGDTRTATLNVLVNGNLPGQYTVTDLGTLGGNSSRAFGMSSIGEVVGSAETANGHEHAFLWQPGVGMTDLGVLPWTGTTSDRVTSRAFAVNYIPVRHGDVVRSTRVIVGESGIASDDCQFVYPPFQYPDSFVWNEGTISYADVGHSARGISSSGVIIGSAPCDGQSTFRSPWNFPTGGCSLASLCPIGYFLPFVPFATTVTSAINNRNQAVGYSGAGMGTRAAMWTVDPLGPYLFKGSEGPTDLGVLPGGDSSYAYGINDNGEVVGKATTPAGLRAFRWSSGTMTNLGTLPGAADSVAKAINSASYVVGRSSDRAVAWSVFNSIADLNALIPADSRWVLTEARAINDLGQIAGEGYHDGKLRAFLLTPAPNNTQSGSNVTVSPGEGTSIKFTNILAPGNTAVSTSTAGPTLPAGFSLGTPAIYYTVSTTAQYSPPVSVCINYEGVQYSDPASLKLFHFEGGQWVDVTASNDTTNRLVCGVVSSLSPFIAAEKKDTSPPMTSAALAGSVGEGGWYRGPVTITLSASDIGGAADAVSTHYRIDEGTEQLYSGPILFSREGRHKLSYWSVDTLGNKEDSQSIAINIDTTPPTTTVSQSGHLAAAGLYDGPVVASLISIDNDSGVAKVFYQVDGGAFQQYAQPFTISGGATHQLLYYGIDAAGNVEVAKTLKISISGQPSIAATILGKGTQGATNFFVDVQMKNAGNGTARNLVLRQVTPRTLAGTGTVTYDPSLSPGVPYTVGDLAPSESKVIRLFLNVSQDVARFSLTEDGSMQNGLGTSFSFSLEQIIEPPPTYTISGRVTIGNEGLRGVTITLGGSQAQTTTTDSGGGYQFNNVLAGGDFNITPSKTNYTFTPQIRTFGHLSGDQTASFTATINLGVPILVSEETSTRAIALDSVVWLRDPFHLNSLVPWGLDRRTRVMLFAMNFDLLPGENISVVTADAEDASHNIYPLTVECVGKVPGYDWLNCVIIRLSDNMGDIGDVLVRLSVRGVASNRVRLGIGHTGGGLPDDLGAVPTPGRQPATPSSCASDPDYTQYHFENGAQGWVSNAAAATVTWTDVNAFHQCHSLAVNFNATPAGKVQAYIAAPLVPAGATLTFHIWIPAASALTSVTPFVVEAAPNYTWNDNFQSVTNLRTGAWNTITLSVPANAATPINKLGVEFKTTATWTGTCYIDSVDW